jgi:GTPase SAR1 family protein
MPEPVSLTVILIAAAVGALVGGTLVVTISINWESIVKAWSGKRLAITGAESTGKTILMRYLTNGVIPQQYTPTQVSEKTKSHIYKLEDLKLALKESLDVPGVGIARDQWESLVKQSDVVLYLVRADLLLEGNKYTEDRLKNDTGLMSPWLKGGKDKHCFVIGTWADKIPGFRDPDGNVLNALANRFSNHPALIQAVSSLRTDQTKVVHVLIASQERPGDQQRLAMLLLKALTGGS